MRKLDRFVYFLGDKICWDCLEDIVAFFPNFLFKKAAVAEFNLNA